MSEKQLKALEEGRKKSWLKKQEVKEEQPTLSEESTYPSLSESEESKTGTKAETQFDPSSTTQESGESSSSSTNTETSEQT